MSGRTRIADWLLLASAAVSAAAIPFAGSFAGGLVCHTALAAAVGGIADWFAVNSLFRKPLGMSFRTELVPRSRDKIIAMAREMVTEEILTTPRLYRVLKQHSLSAAFLTWLAAHREETAALLLRIAEGVLASADKEKLVHLAADTAASEAGGVDWAGLLAKTLQELDRYEDRGALLSALRQAAGHFLRDGLTDEEILSLYRRAWVLYEEKGMGRAMLENLLRSQLGLTDEKAAALIEEKLADWAAGMDDPESKVSETLSRAWYGLLLKLSEDAECKKKVNDAVGGYMAKWLAEDGAARLSEILKEKEPYAARMLAEKALAAAEAALSDDESWRRIDRWILKRLVQVLPAIHDALGASVERALSVYSGEDMARLIEGAVWNDLQMIRVNGTAVGALLGCASYLVFYLLSGGALL